MKHHDCSCSHCHPGKPTPPQGILVPRIIASGRTWLHRQCTTLCITGLPACIQPPLTLVNVSPCGEPRWTPADSCHPLHYQVSIPLLCQVQDACGCLHCGHAEICTEIHLTPACPLPECWRSNMLLIPCTRLLCASCGQDACFTAQLEVLLEGYLLRWEPCQTQRPKPQCPDLPLYPQPHPHC